MACNILRAENDMFLGTESSKFIILESSTGCGGGGSSSSSNSRRQFVQVNGTFVQVSSRKEAEKLLSHIRKERIRMENRTYRYIFGQGKYSSDDSAIHRAESQADLDVFLELTKSGVYRDKQS